MSKYRVKIWALHGFLGLPSDWKAFDVEAISLGSAPSLWHWARCFNERVRAEGSETRNFLLGYSMGGRLALHALVDSPDLWEKGILISTHPGLKKGKEERRASDEAWATRFEKDEWYHVLADWMAQPVFKGTRGPLRLESEFNRSELASQMRHFSLGRQAYLESDKALWVVGERDELFRKLHPEATVIPQAGHRVIFDRPQAIKELLERVISTL